MDRVRRPGVFAASLLALAIGTGIGTAWLAVCAVEGRGIAGEQSPCGDRAGLGEILARLTPARR